MFIWNTLIYYLSWRSNLTLDQFFGNVIIQILFSCKFLIISSVTLMSEIYCKLQLLCLSLPELPDENLKYLWCWGKQTQLFWRSFLVDWVGLEHRSWGFQTLIWFSQDWSCSVSFLWWQSKWFYQNLIQMCFWVLGVLSHWKWTAHQQRLHNLWIVHFESNP